MRAAECVRREAREHDLVARDQDGDLVLVNLDNGSCWETPFAAARVNDSTKVVAAQ